MSGRRTRRSRASSSAATAREVEPPGGGRGDSSGPPPAAPRPALAAPPLVELERRFEPRLLTAEEQAELWRYQSTRDPPPRIVLLRAIEYAYAAVAATKVDEWPSEPLPERVQEAVRRLELGWDLRGDDLTTDERDEAHRAHARAEAARRRQDDRRWALARLKEAVLVNTPGTPEALADARRRADDADARRLAWQEATIYGPPLPPPSVSTRVVR